MKGKKMTAIDTSKLSNEVNEVLLCARSMGLNYMFAPGNLDPHLVRVNGVTESYWPFTNDKQMLALAKHHKLILNFSESSAKFINEYSSGDDGHYVFNPSSINKAVVACVALRQAVKEAVRARTKLVEEL